MSSTFSDAASQFVPETPQAWMASCVVHAMQSITVRSSEVIIIQYAEGERVKERKERQGRRERGGGEGEGGRTQSPLARLCCHF